MKNPITLVIVLAASILFAQGSEPLDMNELPKLSFKLLADSLFEPCGVCVEKMRKQAYSLLNEFFHPGKIIKTNNLCRFIKTKESSRNELLLTCYREREFYKKTPEHGIEKFPLLVFRFHSAESHLVGISDADFTDLMFTESFNSDQGGKYDGELQVVPFRYGDGKSFSFINGENKIIVHCKILKLKKIR